MVGGASQGVYSAWVKRTGSGKDSFIEVSFDASGCGLVHLPYRRMLVGFDAADDWEAQVCGGGWICAVRFKCETGADSEKCYLDEVRIAGS